MTLTDTEGAARAATQAARPKGRRRPSHTAETERRRAWGKEWGQANHENKLRRDREKGRR